MADLPELRLELARLQPALAELPRVGVAAPYGHGYGGVRRRFGFLLSSDLTRRLTARDEADPGPIWRRLRSMVREFQLLDQLQEQTQSWIALDMDSPEARTTREEAYCRVVQSTIRNRWERSWLAWEEEQNGGDYGRLRSEAIRSAEALRLHQHPVDIGALPADDALGQHLLGLPPQPVPDLDAFITPILEEWLDTVGLHDFGRPSLTQLAKHGDFESWCELIRPGMPPVLHQPPMDRAFLWIAHAGALMATRVASGLPASAPTESHCAGDRSHLLAVGMLGRLAVTERVWLEQRVPAASAGQLETRSGQLLRAQVRTHLRRVPVILDALDDTTGWRDVPRRWLRPLDAEPALLPETMSWTQGLVRHGSPVPALRAWLLALAFRDELQAELGPDWAISPRLGARVQAWYLDLAARDAMPDQLPRAWSALNGFLGLEAGQLTDCQ